MRWFLIYSFGAYLSTFTKIQNLATLFMFKQTRTKIDIAIIQKWNLQTNSHSKENEILSLTLKKSKHTKNELKVFTVWFQLGRVWSNFVRGCRGGRGRRWRKGKRRWEQRRKKRRRRKGWRQQRRGSWETGEWWRRGDKASGTDRGMNNLSTLLMDRLGRKMNRDEARERERECSSGIHIAPIMENRPLIVRIQTQTAQKRRRFDFNTQDKNRSTASK